MSQPFRLSAPVARERDVQAQVVDYLRYEQARGRIVWFARCNGGSAFAGAGKSRRYIRFYQLYLPGKTPAAKGMADVHGMLADGRYFALEVKRHGESATEEQIAFLDAVRAGGGIAAVVCSFRDAKSVFNPIDNPLD